MFNAAENVEITGCEKKKGTNPANNTLVHEINNKSYEDLLLSVPIYQIYNVIKMHLICLSLVSIKAQ